MTETQQPLSDVKVGDVIQLTLSDRAITAIVIATRYRHVVVQCGAGEFQFDYSGHAVTVNGGKPKRIVASWKASLRP